MHERTHPRIIIYWSGLIAVDMNWRDLECQTINPCICNSLYGHLFLINHYCLFACLDYEKVFVVRQYVLFPHIGGAVRGGVHMLFAVLLCLYHTVLCVCWQPGQFLHWGLTIRWSVTISATPPPLLPLSPLTNQRTPLLTSQSVDWSVNGKEALCKGVTYTVSPIASLGGYLTYSTTYWRWSPQPEQAFSKLRNSKSTGHDQINLRYIKESLMVTISYIILIVNTSMVTFV